MKTFNQLKEKIKNLSEHQKKSIKVYWIWFLSGFVFLFVVLLLVYSYYEFNDFDRNKKFMLRNDMMQNWMNQNMQIWPKFQWPNWQLPNWQPWPNFQWKRLFEIFCPDGKMSSWDEFVAKFNISAQERFQKSKMIRKNLDLLISKAKESWKDTTILENKLKEIDFLLSGFKWWKEDFLMNPQHFCDQNTWREQINIQIREKMQEVWKVIDNLRP